MLIQRMQASFGKRRVQTLELHSGLNILQAPDETVKSAWCAFLPAMFYGVPAGKNLPSLWADASAAGRLDCRTDAGELALLRATRRPDAPMADFQVLYAGSNVPVPSLTGDTCGKALLGVSREVYARSAFIRQCRLSDAPDADLEHRLASLIASGEEGVSYAGAEEALKKQLHRRRHNKSGQLPSLEAELAATRSLQAAQADLTRQLGEAQAQVRALEGREADLRKELEQLDLWESQRQRQALRDAEDTAFQAEQRVETMKRQLLEDHIPENGTIGRLRGAIINLETVHKNSEKAAALREEAESGLRQAEAALQGSPFAGKTAEEARQEAASPPDNIKCNYLPSILTLVVGLLVSFAASFALFRAMENQPLSFGLLGVLLLITILAAWQLKRKALQNGRANFLLDRYGCKTLEEIAALADTYVNLLESRDAAQADASTKAAAAENLLETLASSEQAILEEIRRFAPEVADIPSGDAALRACAIRRKGVVEAEHAVREARTRCETLIQQLPQQTSDEKLAPPPRGRSSVLDELEKNHTNLTAARSKASQLSGRIQATGDPLILESSAGRLAGQIARMEKEYEALNLALSTLESANAALQKHFSPAISRRAAEIFAELASGAYGSVTFDRLPAENGLPKSAAGLSDGAAAQLYLAVRLAVCELVLPQEKAVPIVLDDALAAFDGDGFRHALQWLKGAARERQILFFTCQSREAEFFAKDSKVSIQRLTNVGFEV